MDLEKVDNDLYEAKRIQQAGWVTMESYIEFKSQAATGLQMFGDVFLQRLGLALDAALTDDALKIMRYWHQACEQHQIIYKMYLAKEKAENDGKVEIIYSPKS